MTLVLHDTYSRAKRTFEPREGQPVTLYVCGPTVYNYAHIGNARPAVVFDVLFRLLRRLYGEQGVVYARNVTDVDDKINAKAAEEGVPISVVTARYLAVYEADMAALGCLTPSVQPHATDHIPEMLAMIGELVQRGAAYLAEGHVLFDTTRFEAYGGLSGRSLDDMIAGARVEVAPYKKNAADFVLWKPSKPGEPVWDSPFGRGRPGWHIECSAMSEKALGLPIDIHGGGHDLIFPHHENEIAQGVCAHGGTDPGAYARYWMHNGFLTMDAEKMSKSLGNVLLVHDLVKRWPGEVVRYALLSAHYRAPLDWTDALLDQSKASLDRLYGALQRSKPLGEVEAQPSPEFEAALQNDLNTPAALSDLFEVSSAVERALNAGDVAAARLGRSRLLAAGALIGLLGQDPDAWFTAGADEALKARVEALIAARGEARRSKDWATADRIRAELTELRIEVMDGQAGAATWRFRE